MPKIKNMIDKNKLVLYLFIVTLAFLVFALIQREPQVTIKPVNDARMKETARLAQENRDLRERLLKIEPAAPVKIVTPEQPASTVDSLPVLAIMAAGNRIPFELVHEDGAWMRPAYQPYWHSRQGQWSSVPDRIQNSYHRLFVTPWTESLWTETIHQVGIAELNDKIHLPVYDDDPANTIAIVAIRQKITDVLILNNQVLLVGTPARSGLQIITLNRQDLINSVSGELLAHNDNQDYLFQLATPDGYEVDFSNAIVNF